MNVMAAQAGPHVVPLYIDEYAMDDTVDCVLCCYTPTGIYRHTAKGCLYITDTHEHVQKGKHASKVAAGGMHLPHVQRLGVNGTSFAVSPIRLRYRCTACSLGKVGNPLARYYVMPYGAMIQHCGTDDHVRRVGDHRLNLHDAGGRPWAVPVVAAPAPVLAVQPPVVVAAVPVVAPAVPVVVPRQPHP